MLEERKESLCGRSLRRKQWVKMQLESEAWADHTGLGNKSTSFVLRTLRTH